MSGWASRGIRFLLRRASTVGRVQARDDPMVEVIGTLRPVACPSGGGLSSAEPRRRPATGLECIKHE